MADKITLRVVTPSQMLLDEEVDEVTAPGALGEFGVLPNHIAFLTLLEPGEMSYKQGTTRNFLAVSGGYAEVLDNTMTVLANSADYADEIDVEHARRTAERAEKEMQQLNPDDKEFIAAAAALRWAKVQMLVANRELGD
ncbi:MAG TPA: F0F1 ATP synthase subunit epsilon [Candidatus Binatia bacterium]|nr:F0F1 ATP synthase subunit epsilon [Candidatus Binatia bacterium]